MSVTINVKKQDLVIVFHHDDQDGALAGSLLKMYYGDNVMFYSFAVNYKEQYNTDYFIHTINSILKNNGNKCQYPVVYFVDYTCPNMDNFCFNCKENDIELVWIDHHISQIEKYKNIDCGGIRSIEHSGCYLTWMYLYPNTDVPLIVEKVSCYDCNGVKGDIQLKYLINRLDSFNVDLNNDNSVFKQYEMCLQDPSFVDILIKEGENISQYLEQQSLKNIDNIEKCNWNNIDCLVLNTWQHGSYLFDQYLNHEGVDFNKNCGYLLVLWYVDRNKQYNYSFYSGENSNIDCSRIAVSLGGGGHKHAAGCRLSYLLFN